MRSALLACLPLTGGISGTRVLSDFDEVCHSHGVSGKAFRVVADPLLATTTVKPCCLPGFLKEDEEDGAEDGISAKEGIRNGHGDVGDEGEWQDSWEHSLGVCRVDCFSRSLEQCVSEGIRSCPQLSSTLAKAACFYNYITSAVPPEKLTQVFDGPGLIMGGPGNTPFAARDWAAQLKVCKLTQLYYMWCTCCTLSLLPPSSFYKQYLHNELFINHHNVVVGRYEDISSIY